MLRRTFLQASGLGLGLSILPMSELDAQELSASDKSVILVWLGGGPTHVETFDPKPEASIEYRSVVGSVRNGPIEIGGLWEKLSKQTHQMNVVRSFSHINNSHGAATHYVMTGHNINKEDGQTHPSAGSVVAAYYGSNRLNGQPTYVRQQKINGDDSAYLGAVASPFFASGEGLNNLGLNVARQRFDERNNLLESLNNLAINPQDMNEKRLQANAILRGKVRESFDITREPDTIREQYGNTDIGRDMLLARRLIEAGTKFVTIHYGGWDMHSDIKKGLEGRVPPLDTALASLTLDLEGRGMLDNVLVVVCGEFGRTPKINSGAGRDHWGRLSTLAFIGGAYDRGRVIGESDRSISEPKSEPISPMDLRATIFDHMRLPTDLQYLDHAGRPQFMLPEGKCILG